VPRSFNSPRTRERKLKADTPNPRARKSMMIPKEVVKYLGSSKRKASGTAAKNGVTFPKMAASVTLSQCFLILLKSKLFVFVCVFSSNTCFEDFSQLAFTHLNSMKKKAKEKKKEKGREKEKKK
jgi:hypothetical protein